MTDFLGAVLNPTALAGHIEEPTLEAGLKLASGSTSDLSDWVLYIATALFVAEVLVCSAH